MKLGDGPKSVRVGLFLKYDREIGKWSENWEREGGRVDRYAYVTFRVGGVKNMFKPSRSHDHYGHHAPI